MEQIDQLTDWTFHYQYINRVRRTKKQKQRFLSTLVTDIAKVRQDIRVIEYKQNKQYVSSNVYIGDVVSADRIICTYYDTPLRHLGPYYLFDRLKQRKGTLRLIIVSTLIYLLVGLAATLLYTKNGTSPFDLRQFSTWAVILCYGIYFVLFSKLTKGLSSRKNKVRNTSSILAILSLIMDLNDKKTAFAFIDEGCFGDTGLDFLKETCKPSAQLYYLDCVGGNEDLHFVGHQITEKEKQRFITHKGSEQQVNYIFCAQASETEQGMSYYLEKSSLNQVEIDQEKLTKISDYFNH
ncbi:hypothetical protein [Enterococcus termitis]|uniref:Uncharacterized protein n=1 Tax=Enterococcus termitis TaxID=332950 RepID=A0A1E5GB06_9ENTE|nr:hypothetical protein [Enterococcus termitis]OEG09831.1 hypothetical protein BCR25_10015 [Enterococcus termitis]OJG98335.1 hypothetical protein RV18_GL003236 [Enterococcus termitis]